jgi:hypothetical protein
MFGARDVTPEELGTTTIRGQGVSGLVCQLVASPPRPDLLSVETSAASSILIYNFEARHHP